MSGAGDTNQIEIIFKKISEELQRAAQKHPPLTSKHQGYAVIKEELDELWDSIKHDDHPWRMREEAVQVAAMAIAFIWDLCPFEGGGDEGGQTKERLSF